MPGTYIIHLGSLARLRGQSIESFDLPCGRLEWEEGWRHADRVLAAGGRVCRGCGCTDKYGCDPSYVPGAPCHWIESDLCSTCKQ